MKDFDWPELRKTGVSAGLSLSPGASLQERAAKAEKDGYEAGYVRGEQAAAAELARQISALETERASVSSAVIGLQAARTALEAADALGAQEAQRASVELAYELCETILEREMQRDGVVLETVARAIALLPSREATVLRVSEQDYPLVASQFAGGSVRVITDSEVGLGGCIVEAGAARVDARWETALARVREAIGLN
jgi:flagellar biosynthesis/type III secretory pathway protein FliH